MSDHVSRPLDEKCAGSVCRHCLHRAGRSKPMGRDKGLVSTIMIWNITGLVLDYNKQSLRLKKKLLGCETTPTIALYLFPPLHALTTSSQQSRKDVCQPPHHLLMRPPKDDLSQGMSQIRSMFGEAYKRPGSGFSL